MKDLKGLSNDHTVAELEAGQQEQYDKHFSGITVKSVRVDPGGWFLPEGYLKFEEQLSNFKFRPDDVVITTFPKCGTTWMQEIVWTMRNNPNLDNPEAEKALFTRSPFIEDMLYAGRQLEDSPPAPSSTPSSTSPFISLMIQDFMERCPGKDPSDGIMLQLVETMKEPRIIKTHLPFSLLSKDLLDTCKVIYLARNPKDALLSHQHHSRLMKGSGFVGTQDDFMQYFGDDMVSYCPFGEHLKEAWCLKTHPKIKFIFYEDLKADNVGEIKKIASFIGVPLTDQQLKNVVHKTSFKEMQATDPTKMREFKFFNEDIQKKDGTFFRQGEAGSWRGKFNSEQEAKVDAWVEKNIPGSGIEFKY